MKIRNGFVSNSSSSSFILAYNKHSVYSDPKNIAAYIDDNLRQPILFRGINLGEGEDIFELDMHQKDYLLDHKDRFIKYSKGTEERTVYTETEDGVTSETKEVPYVRAITDYYSFYHNDVDYDTDSIDMSDVPNFEYTMEEYVQKKDDPEFKENLKISENWYNIQRERADKKFREKRKEELVYAKNNVLKNYPNANPDDIAVEWVDVSNRCSDSDTGSDWEFPDRYFGLPEKTYYQGVWGNDDSEG